MSSTRNRPGAGTPGAADTRQQGDQLNLRRSDGQLGHMLDVRRVRRSHPYRGSDGLAIIEERSAIIRNGIEVVLSPQQFRIFLRVARAKYGISAEALTDYIYADDPDGGPLRGRKAMHVQRVHINRKLEPIHVSIQPHKKGGGGVYEVKVEAALIPERARARLRSYPALSGGFKQSKQQ